MTLVKLFLALSRNGAGMGQGYLVQHKAFHRFSELIVLKAVGVLGVLFRCIGVLGMFVGVTQGWTEGQPRVPTYSRWSQLLSFSG